jgi:hypothetical protein
MQVFLSRLMAAIQQLGRRRPMRRPEKRIGLRLESLEERQVPSTVAPKFAVPSTVPAHAASFAPVADTHHGSAVAEPERCVHGYKWRRPPWYPWNAAISSQGAVAQGTLAIDAVMSASTSSNPLSAKNTHEAVANHLVAGGADGLTIVVSTSGQVGSPVGPLTFNVGLPKV